MFDYQITRSGEAYTEFREFTSARKERMMLTDAPQVQKTAAPSGKEQYLKAKQEASEARKKATKMARLISEMERIESEIDEISAQMSGEAATDYKKVAELDLRKNELEDRLLEIYEELEG